MQDISRRSLIAGAGSALALGATANLGVAQSSDGSTAESNDGTARDSQSGQADLETALGYVYGMDDGTQLTISRLDDETYVHAGPAGLEGDVEPEWQVTVSSTENRMMSDGGTVWVGSFDVDASASEFSSDGSRGDFEIYAGTDYDDSELLAATDGDVLLHGSPDWVDATLSKSEDGEKPLFETQPGLERVLGALDVEQYASLLTDATVLGDNREDVDVDPEALPDVFGADSVRTDDAIIQTLVAWYDSGPTEDQVQTFEDIATTATRAENATVDSREDEGLVVVEIEQDYTPPEERPETAGMPRYDGYDAESGDLLFTFDRGEQLPVEHYEIEIEEESYEGNWARDQETIGEGDTIAIDADAVEPGDTLMITYEDPDGSFSSGTGTSALTDLPFDVEFDPDARTASITYGSGPPLSADRVRVVVGDEERTVRPWEGELREDDSVTLTDLPMNEYLTIEYERSDGEDAWIGGTQLDAPGSFRFEYDAQAEALTVKYPDHQAELADAPAHIRQDAPDQQPLEASRYEVSFDDEPSPKQWHDSREEIQPGETLTYEDVPVDTSVTVSWIGADGQRYEVASTHTLPEVEFEFEYDDESEELVIRHAGGQPVDPEPIQARIHDGSDERTEELDVDDQFAEGDEFTVSDVDQQAWVDIMYRDRYLESNAIHRHTSPEN